MNKKLKYLLASNGLFVFANSILIPVYALFIESINGGIELAGLLFGLGFMSSSLASLVVTRFADSAQLESRMMKFNFLIRGIVWMYLAFFPSITAMFFGQILIGITDGIGSPVFNELFSRYLDRKKHIKEWGTWQFLAGLAVAIGSVISGFVVVHLGFSILFVIMALLAFAALAVFRIGER